MSDSNREMWGHLSPKEKEDRRKDEELETLRRRVAELERERDRWKSAHCEMANRNKLLRDRPDLPIERLQAYKQITAENAELKRQVEKLREVVTMILEAEMPDCKSQEEFGGYVLDDSIREKAKAALLKAAKGEVEG